MSCVSVCVCSRGVLLQRLPDADVAAAADGRPGLRRDALLLHGGEDAELLHRFAGTLKQRRSRRVFYAPFYFCTFQAGQT